MNVPKKKSRVLAIDDEPSMIEWLKILLEHEGHEVRTAMVGTRGEDIFRSWKPDVVVTDMMLPDADGLELLRKFKQTHGDTEVIVITSRYSRKNPIAMPGPPRAMIIRLIGSASASSATIASR